MNMDISTLQVIQKRLIEAARIAGRDPGSITLVAVGKTFPADALRVLALAGQRNFAENYLQEALEKQAALADLPLIWHFIGPIQRNKTGQIAAHFDWVHSVDRELVAERLSAARSETQPPLNVCLQVNISRESSKSGVLPEQLPALARFVATLPRIRLRGLMAIPQPLTDVAARRQQFAAVRDCLEQVRQSGIPMDTLSMGMSADFELAIAEGATMVRLGSLLFGHRHHANKE